MHALRILLLLIISASLTAASPVDANLLGAGASFPAPLLLTWADEYRDVTGGHVLVNYQSIGSGGGIRQFLEQTVHFGASEVFLSDEHLAEAQLSSGGEAFNLPFTLGDVVLLYNLPGVDTGLVLDASAIAALFLGRITRWDDEKLRQLNPDVSLPDLPVSIVHRADGSGTTSIFTSYLTKTSLDWAEQAGSGTSVNWPVGLGASGNEGVAGIISSIPGALGYNSLVYAQFNDISYAAIINQAGNVIIPSLEATSAAAEVVLPKDSRITLTDTRAEYGYPLTSFSWLLVYEQLDANRAFTSRAQAIELVRFLIWVLIDGQQLSERLSFASLPENAVANSLLSVARLTWQGENIGRILVDEALYRHAFPELRGSVK